MICELMDVDIPQLQPDGIVFTKYDCVDDKFDYTYFIQSSSNPSPFPSSFDADGLESFFKSKKQEQKQ